MGIAQKVSREFADGVRARGQSYFAKGRVAITSAKAGEVVVARVRGTETYKVKLRLRDGRLSASCTCLYFGPEGEPCKHLWATILASDAKGLLPVVPVRPLRLVRDVRYHVQQARAQAQRPPDLPPQPPHPPFDPRIPVDAQAGLDALTAAADGVPPYYPPPYQPPRHVPAPPPRRAGGPALGPKHPNANPNANRNRNSNGGGKVRPPHPPQGQAPRAPSGPPPGQPYPSGQPYPYAGKYPPRGGNNGPAPAARGPRPPQQKLPKGQRPPHGKAARRAEAGKKPEVKKASLFYVVDAAATLAQNAVVVTLARRQRKPGTERAVLRPWWPSMNPAAGGWRPEPEDRVLMALLDEAQIAPSSAIGGASGVVNGAPSPTSSSMSPSSPLATPTAASSSPVPPPRRFVLRPEVQAQMVERLCRTNRCRLRRTEDEDDPPALRWDDGRPWRFTIDVRCADPSAKRWNWRGGLRRDDDRMDLAEPLVLLPGLVIRGVGRAARFDDAGIFAWMLRLRHEKEMTLPEAQQDTMLGRILGDSRVPPDELVEGLDLDYVDLPPTPCLTIRTPRQNWGSDNLIAELEFDYDGARVASFPPGRVAVQTDRLRAVRRDVRAETRSKERLDELGFREAKDFRVEPGTMEIAPKKVPGATRELALEGWRVEAEGILYRTASDFKLAVATGIDWFELSGRIDFGGQSLALPEILDAARRGETMIALGDGSMGMLPEDWLKKYGLLADLGSEGDGENLRFSKAQAGLLDALLAAQPGSKCDAAFTKVRKGLHAFEGVEPLEAPPGFQGELRPYQEEGLGWLDYLRSFDFGGILADDMGLGKTVQVLALLQRRRARRQSRGPSLIVVPRSLVFNWLQESAKFTPKLRVLDYTGPNRHPLRDDFKNYDLIVTTYGTLRSDVVELSAIAFDYAILDEAQAIKNADSQAAKAARLLKARHRLAMSGTPIENHLGELWSIFEFLNPGMLGTAGVFKKNAGGAGGPDEQARTLLSRALRPFILRRTKKQVVKDLPDKVELTLSCDLEPAQRKLYEDLRAHYRAALLKTEGKVAGSKIEVLEALLRLRQAACHPALIDPSRIDEPSAKLDMLLPQMAEVAEEGHKILVFSQFTSFLAIVRKKLDAEGIAYEYLDGRTRDREARVANFQNNPAIPVFLISLKAGGLGLNLTAAEYVYLLDPWWNPAVEAQAIDRSHRIGQTETVFAYRLIARDTVEQKILDLQQKKRDLADAILNADDNRVIQGLTRDDLEFLLS